MDYCIKVYLMCLRIFVIVDLLFMLHVGFICFNLFGKIQFIIIFYCIVSFHILSLASLVLPCLFIDELFKNIFLMTDFFYFFMSIDQGAGKPRSPFFLFPAYTI